MNNDLISRSALIKSYFNHCRTDFENENCCMANENVFNIIYNAPTVDERPRGEWDKSPVNRFYTCSFCGKTSPDLSSYMKMNFCPNCGADMRGGVE